MPRILCHHRHQFVSGRLEDARNSANLRRVRRVVPGKNRLLDTDRPLSPFSLGGGAAGCANTLVFCLSYATSSAVHLRPRP